MRPKPGDRNGDRDEESRSSKPLARVGVGSEADEQCDPVEEGEGVAQVTPGQPGAVIDLLTYLVRRTIAASQRRRMTPLNGRMTSQ